MGNAYNIIAKSPNTAPPQQTISGGSVYPALLNTSGAAQNYTYSQIHSAWGSFNGVQLVFMNNSTSAANIDNTVISVGSTIYPSNANDISNSTGSWQTPLGSITVPGGTSKQFGIYVTPIQPIQSIARATGESDGGKYPLLFTRHYVQTGNTTAPYALLPTTYASPWTSIWNSSNNYGISLQAAYSGSVNGVTTIANISPPLVCTTGGSLYCPSVGVIFSYDQIRTSICPIGDSTFAGNFDTVTTICSPGFQATGMLANNGKLVSFYNGSVSGATMPNIQANATTIINNLGPDIILIASWTSNSSYSTQAQWDTQWQEAMTIVGAQLAKGGQVLIYTPWPNNNNTSTTAVYQQVIRNRVINSGLPYVDMNQFIGINGGWANAAYTVDGTHGSVAGYAAIGAATAAVLSMMVP